VKVARLHLIDATFELFRAYFAMPSEKSPQGVEIGATRGLISSMLALLHEPDVTHVGAATDHVIESFRNDLFAGYKTGEGIEPELWAQFPLAEEALDALGIVVWAMREFEADDALATAAAKFADQVERVVILSPDKDLAQCVRGDHVVCFDRLRKRRYDEAGVVEKFGVPPRSIPDYLALTGDTADGIPGLPGWGAKSAAALLAAYGTIEDIPLDPNAWQVKVRGAARLAATLREGLDDALLYKTLATLRTDANVTNRLSDLQWRGVPRQKFTALCDRLGLGGLRDRPRHWDDTR
jgi:5'-3' exonuclease